MQGFRANFAINFMEKTNRAIENAAKIHEKDPFERRRHIAVVTPPPFANPPRPPAPFNIESGGSPRTGIGNSSNIVVDQSTYENITQMVDRVDDDAGAEFYKCCMEIEQMCQNTFIVPETISQILAITSQVKGSLGQFRSMTEEVNIQARNFARNMIEADPPKGSGGSSGMLAVSEASVGQARSRTSQSIDRQCENMDRTVQRFNEHIPSLQQRRAMERANAEREEREALEAANGGTFSLFSSSIRG